MREMPGFLLSSYVEYKMLWKLSNLNFPKLSLQVLGAFVALRCLGLSLVWLHTLPTLILSSQWRGHEVEQWIHTSNRIASDQKEKQLAKTPIQL